MAAPNVKTALDLQRRAARARHSAGTAANQASSRSHAVLTVRATQHASCLACV
jgi:hypothetical protein